VLAKLDRAEEHRQAFDDLFEQFHASNPYSILSEYDPETGWHSLRWNVLEDLPLQRLGLLFGDMISNLRTTLDYLVWQLVLAAGSRPGRRTGFPVVRKEKDWDVQSRAALRGVAPDWTAEIKARQPFQRPAGVPSACDPDHVNNLNKHRFPPGGGARVEHLGPADQRRACPGRDARDSRLSRPADHPGR
jgi:hypothetical protein